MKGTNKQRGKYFENKIVDAYRETLNVNKLECYRSGSSGARTSLEITGDISFSDPIKYKIITECKYRLDASLDDLFPNLNSESEKWIDQNTKQKSLFKQNVQIAEVSENSYPICSVIIGRPHQSVENYYTILLHGDFDSYEFKQKIITYSKKNNKYFMVVPFSEYLNYLKFIFNN